MTHNLSMIGMLIEIFITIKEKTINELSIFLCMLENVLNHLLKVSNVFFFF